MKPGKAVLVGYLVTAAPGVVLVLAVAAGVWAWVGVAGAAAAALLAATASWLWWAFAIRRWRAWAVAAGVPPGDLQRASVAAGLLGPPGSRIAQAEHSVRIPLFWGLIAGGLLVCLALGLELSSYVATAVKALMSLGLLLMVIGIALDSMRREPPLAAWFGIGSLFLACALQWLFVGLGVTSRVWLPLRAGPAIVGVLAIAVLGWLPVRNRHDERGLLAARLSVFSALVLAAVLIPISIGGIRTGTSTSRANPTSSRHDPYSFGTGAKLAATTLPDGLSLADVVPGTGAPNADGECLSVQYVLWLKDGTRIDSSVDHGADFKFVLGRGDVIRRWDEGLAGMKVGGVRPALDPALTRLRIAGRRRHTAGLHLGIRS